MSQNLRDEFEEYVKKLTVEISKEIFLKHLQELYVSYDNNLQNTLKVSANLQEAVQDLSAGIQTASNIASQTQQDSKASLQKIEAQIRRVEAQTESLFTSMRKLNEGDRKAMLDDLAEFSKRHSDMLNQIIINGCGNIDDRLSHIITAKQLQQFREVLEQNSQSSQRLADYVNSILTDKTEEGLQHIQEVMDEGIQTQMRRVKDQLTTIDETIEQILKTQGDTFSDVIASAGDKLAERLRVLLQNQENEWKRMLKEQAELIRQASPDKKAVEQLASSGREIEMIARRQQKELELGRKNLEDAEKRIKILEESMDDFIKRAQANDERLKELVTEQQIQLHQAEENRKFQKLFVQCSSALTLILLVLLIFFQNPSFFWGLALIASAFIIWCFTVKK